MRKLRLLLIEDNEPDAHLVNIYLKESFGNNFDLEIVSYLAEGLHLLEKDHSFDTVLCDLALPDSYGMETFNKVHNLADDIPVIILTGYGDDQIALKAVAHGAADFLNKNELNSNLLRRSIAYSIERRNLQRQLLSMEDLRRQKEVAEQLARTRQEFLSVMSHEIRTPLHAVLGITQLLLDEDPSLSQKEHLNTLQYSANNLLSLINNILDLSKVESGKIQLEKLNFNIREFIAPIIQSFKPSSEQKDCKLILEISKDVPENLVGDPTRLMQIISNLLHNAVKFTDRGVIGVKISKDTAEPDNEKEVRIAFEVSDTGIGIESERFGEIFDYFSQGHPGITRLFGGSGLGLSISKRLVNLMGGDIKVESSVGSGSTFSFSLTMGIGVAEPALPIDLTKNYNLGGIHILLVEDNETIRGLTQKLLVKWGAKVTTADNGSQAVEKAKKYKFDLVLMDLQMPIMDGYEAFRFIRAEKKSLPVIALTAYAMDDDKLKVSQAGMDDFISKPIDQNDLYKKILRHTLTVGRAVPFVRSTEESQNLPKDSVLNQWLEILETREAKLEYLESFAKGFKELPEKIKQALKDSDWNTFDKIVHKATPNVKLMNEHNLLNIFEELKQIKSTNAPSSNGKAGIADQLMAEIEKTCLDAYERVRRIANEVTQ